MPMLIVLKQIQTEDSKKLNPIKCGRTKCRWQKRLLSSEKKILNEKKVNKIFWRAFKRKLYLYFQECERRQQNNVAKECLASND